MRGVEAVFHQAALPSVPRSVADPLASHEVNVTGTLSLLLAARAAGVRRVVYASSSSVYGDTPTLPKSEDLPTNPLSPYAVSKLAASTTAACSLALYGLETVCLRYFNVFGPRQDPQSQYAAVIPQVHHRGDGAASRHGPRRRHARRATSTYIDNVVRANLGRHGRARGVAGERLQRRLRPERHLLDLVAALNADPRDLTSSPAFGPPRPGQRARTPRPTFPAPSGLPATEPSVQFEAGSGADHGVVSRPAQ